MPVKRKDDLLDVTNCSSHKIDLGYLASLEVAGPWAVVLEKIHCFIRLTHLRVLALVWKPKHVEAEVEDRKIGSSKIKNDQVQRLNQEILSYQAKTRASR